MTRNDIATFFYEDKEYGLTSDTRQFTLFEVMETNNEEDGKPEIRKQNAKYYRTLGGVFQALYRKGIRESDYGSLEELQDNVERCTQQIKELIKDRNLMMKSIDIEISVDSS